MAVADREIVEAHTSRKMLEALAEQMGADAEYLRTLEEAEQEIERGETITIEELKRSLGLN